MEIISNTFRKAREAAEAQILMEQAMTMDHNDPEYRMTEAAVREFMASHPAATVNDFYQNFMRAHNDELEGLNPFLPLTVIADINEERYPVFENPISAEEAWEAAAECIKIFREKHPDDPDAEDFLKEFRWQMSELTLQELCEGVQELETRWTLLLCRKLYEDKETCVEVSLDEMEGIFEEWQEEAIIERAIEAEEAE